MFKKMQLLSPSDITCKENLIFHEPVQYTIKNTDLEYEKIKIETNYPNGEEGPLVIESPFLFSFGVNERRDKYSNRLVGYSIPVCLWSKDKKPTQEEKDFYEFLKFLTESCHKKLDEEYCTEMANCLNYPLYQKDKTKPPVLYAKLMYSERLDKIISLFRVKGNKNPDPLDFLNKYCNVKLALLIEGIYISDEVVSIQMKVHEVYVKPLKQRQSLLNIEEEEEQEEEESEEEEETEEEEEQEEEEG